MTENYGPCPRCGEAMDVPPGGSRMAVDRELDICGPCCSDEAYRDAAGDPPIPPNEWPVRRRYDSLGRPA